MAKFSTFFFFPCMLFVYVSALFMPSLVPSHIWYFHIFCGGFSGCLLNTIFDRLQEILFYVFMRACVVKCIHTNTWSKVQVLQDLTTVSSNFCLLEHFCENFKSCVMSSFQISLLVLGFIRTVHLIYWFVLFWHSVWWSSNITSNYSLCHTLLNAYVKSLLYLETVMLKTVVYF